MHVLLGIGPAATLRPRHGVCQGRRRGSAPRRPRPRVRRLNTLGASELSGLPLAFAINTGDTTDNQQYNELRWLIDILDGGNVSLTSGGPAYEGVQQGNTLPYYYHPADPGADDYGRLHAFPAYPGLVDAGESSLASAGLQMPWYAVFGNHAGLVQGTVPAAQAFERIATGPIKIVAFPFGIEQRVRFTRDLLRTPAAGSGTPADRNVELIIVSPLAP